MEKVVFFVIREMAIMFYLFVFRIIFSFFKLFPQKEKTIFVTYFGYNILHTIEALETFYEGDIVIVKSKHCRVDFQNRPNRTILDFKRFFVHNWLIFIYHLATSKKVFVDNYEGFLAASNFKNGTVCIQLWHAAGAIKKFGLEDISVKTRSKSAIKRFKKVYNRFHYVVVGSDKMTDIFCKSFGLTEDRILHTGIPRTDLFFDREKGKKIKKMIFDDYPILQNKKVILYAPTFRDGQMNSDSSPLDIKKMHNAFKDEYVLIMKTHPLVKNNMKLQFPDFVIDLSHYKNINELLLITDILISDYSSIPFEYCLLEKPMIFYPYDLEEYQDTRGIWEEYHQMVAGPIVKNTEEIIDIIQKNQFDIHEVIEFKKVWNKYSNGKSSENLVSYLYNTISK